MVILYAPNVHTGGGIVLLRALLAGWQRTTALRLFLDARAREHVALPTGAHVSWVAPTIIARLRAEAALRRTARHGDVVLCFHGLPPQLVNPARVVVFQQNRNYIGSIPISRFHWRTGLRLCFERFVSKAFRHRVSLYVVQTESMRRAIADWYGAPSKCPPVIKVVPFVDSITRADAIPRVEQTWDFIYVADGEAHKNHRTLVNAWQLLAKQGVRPSLALTLGPRDGALKHDIEIASRHEALRVVNLGVMSREEIMALYAKAGALIFPSMAESFGLPLIEAAHMGVPILAPELDYVRDVCTPTETFDPNSPVSIARAVKRFLGMREEAVPLRTPAEFWNELLQPDLAPQ